MRQHRLESQFLPSQSSFHNHTAHHNRYRSSAMSTTIRGEKEWNLISNCRAGVCASKRRRDDDEMKKIKLMLRGRGTSLLEITICNFTQISPRTARERKAEERKFCCWLYAFSLLAFTCPVFARFAATSFSALILARIPKNKREKNVFCEKGDA